MNPRQQEIPHAIEDGDSLGFYDILAHPNAEYIDGAYGFLSAPPLESFAQHTNTFVHDTANPVDDLIPSFGSFSTPPSAPSTPNQDIFQIDFPSSGAGQPNDHSWTDDAPLQFLPASQPVENRESFNGFISPMASSLVDTNGFIQSVSDSQAENPTKILRGLPRRRSRYRVQNIGQRANAIPILPSKSPADPLERWKESPPEGEAASFSAIERALKSSSLLGISYQRSKTPGFKDTDAFRHHRPSSSRALSTTSGESATSGSSQHSSRSARSASSKGNPSRISSGVRKKRTDAKREKRSSANNPRIFCCTFCCDRFKSKYDWVRHEKSLHLDLESWTCTPFGGAVVLPSTGRSHCAYCSQLDPSIEHLQKHNHGLCKNKEKPTFRRKDHLIQHIRLFHRLDTVPLIEDWKSVVSDFPSRCGFCNERMSTWNERADHLTVHFREGCTMVDWKGDHEFPPEVAMQVRHGVPPYLLDFESRTLVPFSATDGAVNDHLAQMLSRAKFENEQGRSNTRPEVCEAKKSRIESVTVHEEPRLDCYTEVLTRHLSHYAQQMMSSGIIPSDEMFQSEARRLLFDSDDPWNQTMADNHEWLAQFREEQNNSASPGSPEEFCRST